MPSSPIGLNVSTSGHRVGGLVDVVEADDRQHALLRAVDQVERGPQDRDAGDFGADQRARDVEAVLRQQLVEIFVAGDAARDFRIARADEVAVAIAEIRPAAR